MRPILIDLPAQLDGPRIALRPWCDADAWPLFNLIDASRDHLTRWLPWPDLYHDDTDAVVYVRQAAAHWATREDFSFGIFDGSDQLLGGIGLHPRVARVPSFEIGYWIGAPFEGRGYVSEAVQVTTIFCFERFLANRLVIRCDARNTRSAAVARRNGYVYEGTARADAVGTDGVLCDTMTFSMLAPEYAAVRPTWPE